jgi:ATP-dependent Clp protease ATP-binding subunit ClpA
MSRAAKRAADAAEAAAARLGHGRLDSVHLLLGLLAEKSAASVALGRRGVREEDLAKQASALYEGPPGKRARDLDRDGAEWRESLALAQDEAETRGAFEISPAHLLLAATSDDAWTAYRALGALGVEVEAMRADLEELARAEANDALDG